MAAANDPGDLGVTSIPFRSKTICGSFIAGGDPMPAPARAKEAPIESLPLEERIRRRAYELYVERGNESGSELDDWLQAEEEVLQTLEEPLTKTWIQDAQSPAVTDRYLD
jgi:hypothetical protein